MTVILLGAYMKIYIAMSAVAILASGCVSENPREIVRRAGYLTTVPPSTNYGPGNIVWKRTNRYNDKDDISLGYICSPEYVTFPGSPEKGMGEINDFGRKKDFSFNADNLQKLGFSTSAQYVSNLTIKFSNIEYLEYGLDKLEAIEKSLGPKCRNVLCKQRQKQNAHIVRSAFKADLDYAITYKASASASIKATILKEIEAGFGITLGGNQGRVGRGLYYGVSVDPLY